MLVRCWGARGSIPVSGKEYLRYGGDTVCMEVRSSGGGVVIIDAGTGIRRLGKQLACDGIHRVDLLFTHAHWDHLLGFPFFGLLYDPSAEIRVFGLPSAQKSIRQMVSSTMAEPHFPVPLEAVHAVLVFHESDEFAKPLDLGGLSVTPVALSHPGRGLGYKVVEEGKSFVFLTDNELGYHHDGGLEPAEVVRFCRGADLLIHDAVYTPEEYAHRRSWGHSSFTDALDLALQAEVKALGLFHHHQDRTDDQVDAMVDVCRERIASEGAELECFAVSAEMRRSL